MSVVAAAAAVGPGAASYGQPCGGGGGGAGARKRKDVVQDQEAEVEVEGQRGDGGAARLLRWREPPHGLFVLETVREGDDEEKSSIGPASEGEEEEDGEEVQSRRRGTPAGGLSCMDALDDALPIKSHRTSEEPKRFLHRKIGECRICRMSRCKWETSRFSQCMSPSRVTPCMWKRSEDLFPVPLSWLDIWIGWYPPEGYKNIRNQELQ